MRPIVGMMDDSVIALVIASPVDCTFVDAWRASEKRASSSGRRAWISTRLMRSWMAKSRKTVFSTERLVELGSLLTAVLPGCQAWHA
jgi:hypothetical protein